MVSSVDRRCSNRFCRRRLCL